MKKLVILFFLISTNLIAKCPNFTGVYKCSPLYQNSFETIHFISMTEDTYTEKVLTTAGALLTTHSYSIEDFNNFTPMKVIDPKSQVEAEVSPSCGNLNYKDYLHFQVRFIDQQLGSFAFFRRITKNKNGSLEVSFIINIDKAEHSSLCVPLSANNSAK